MKNTVIVKEIIGKNSIREILVNKTSGLALYENNVWILSPNIRQYEKDVKKHLPRIIKKENVPIEQKK